jgi:uncharacterized membrane protein YdjX (TVP38/TMEM64 family)
MTHARRLVAIAALVAVVTVLVLLDPVHQALVSVLSTAQRLAAGQPVAAASLVVLFAALAAMIAFVSSWIVLPFAVFTWGTVPALALLWVGWLLGGAGSYALGRFVGRPAVGWITSPQVLERYERRISNRSTFGLVLLLQLGLPSEIPGYLLGLVRYPFLWYLLALGIAELVHGIPAVFLGSGLVERQLGLVVAVAVGLAALTLTAAWAVRGRLANHDVAPAQNDVPVEV